MESGSQRWIRRHSNSDFTSSAAPDPLLVDYAHCFKSQEIIADVASGTGRNALYIATLGCVSLAFDVSITALEQCRKSAKEGMLNVHPVAVDLDKFRFPPNVLDAAVCFNYLNRELMVNLRSAIKSGGWLVYKTMNSNFLKDHPKFNPDYVLEDGELERVFGDLRVIISQDETTLPRVTKSFIVAQMR